MLTPRTKILILIVGAVIVLGLIIVTVFNLWPGVKPGAEEAPAPVDLSFLEPPADLLPSGQVFDASNKEAFAALTGTSAGQETMSPLEKEARDLAEFFVERFGTYTADAAGAQIDDLQDFMTVSMQTWSQAFKKAAMDRTGYFAATAEVAATEKISFSASARRAQFSVLTNRAETKGNNTEEYQQTATVELRQNAQGEWQVNSLVWGDKE